MDIYSNDNNILNSLATEPSTNLEINEFIELVKSLNEEKREPKKLFFDKLKERVITYKDFFEENEEDLKNLILLIELMKNQLISDSEYLEKTKEILIDLYDNLSKYNETKEIHIKTIMNENEDIQKMYYERFNLFKLIKNEVNVVRELYNKLKDKYKEVEEIIIDANEKSNLLNRYFIESLNDEISKIYSIYQNYLNNNNKLNLWINKEKQIYIKNLMKNLKKKQI